MAKNPSSSSGSLDVEEEYSKVIHTKSFVDMWEKVHQINPNNGGKLLLDPSQELVMATAASAGAAAGGDSSSAISRLLSLLIEFFDLTFQACVACEDLLISTDCASSQYGSIRRVLIEFIGFPSDSMITSPSEEFGELAWRVDQDNPFSPPKLARFLEVRSNYRPLVAELKKAHRRIIKRLRLIKIVKKSTGITALMSKCTVPAAAMAVRPINGGAAAAVAGESKLERLAAGVEAAAKGAYAVGKDFETIGLLVRQAYDEVEQERSVAKLVLSGAAGCRVAAQVAQVAQVVERGGAVMAEKILELEQHVNLCLVGINRSRGKAVQAITGGGTGGEGEGGHAPGGTARRSRWILRPIMNLIFKGFAVMIYMIIAIPWGST